MTSCTAPHVGFFSSHRGSALCCQSDKHNVSPLDFWNGSIQKEVRTLMANGQEHDLCKGCYNSERKGDASFRQIYNSSLGHMKQQNMPQWIDLDWSNFCNLKCVMCDASRSSTWAKETGEYTDTNYIRQTPQQHIDEVYKLSSTNLRYLNLQGGEPSMMKEYDDYLQYLIDIGASKNCEVTVVTNLTNINKQFYKRLEQFKLIKLGVSIDSYGLANNFIRYPSKFDFILRNMLWIKDTPFQVAVSVAFQVTSMFNVDTFLSWLYDMQHLYKLAGKTLDIQLQLVRSPSALHIQHAPLKLKQQCIEHIQQYHKGNKRLNSAAVLEIRLLHILKELQKPHITSQPFVDYVNKIANTRGLSLQDYLEDWELIQD